MNRRDYLIGVGGLGAISGCLSNESTDDTGSGNGDGQTNDTEDGNGEDGSNPTNDTQDGDSSEGDDTGPATSPDPNPTTEPGELEIGDTYRTSDGMILSVLDLATSEVDGVQAALAYVYAKNETGGAHYTPFTEEWSLLAGNQQYDAQYMGDDPLTYEHGEIHDGIVREGWILYAIPDGLTASDLTVAWSGDETVTWSW